MIVCDCMGVEDVDVKKYVRENPGADIEEICDVLEIGLGCGCCREDECDRIEISIVDLLKDLKEGED